MSSELINLRESILAAADAVDWARDRVDDAERVHAVEQLDRLLARYAHEHHRVNGQ